MENPALYCGTYHKYNNGSIDGKWMDLTDYSSVGEFLEACRELHKDEKDPEFMFQDFENFPEYMYSESLSAKDLEPILEYANLDEQDRILLDDFAGAIGSDAGLYTIEQIRDSVVIKIGWDSLLTTEEQVAYDYVESGGIEIPEHLEAYFDYGALGRELMFDMAEGEYYIFNMNRI